MNLIDIIRALPGMLLLGLVPGLAVVSLLRPTMPGWWRLAAAPGLSIGGIGILGLVYHQVRAPFELATVLPPVAVLALVAAARAWRRPAAALDPMLPLRSRHGATVLAAALVAGLLSASIAVVSYRVGPLPPETDNPIHAAITQSIATQHDVVVGQPIPITQTSSVRIRAAFEGTAALVADIGGLRPEAAMLPLVLLAVLLLPLSLAVLMYEATRSWPMAALAPLLGVGMTLIPWALEYGEFPYLADATLVVPLVVSGRRALLGIDRGRELGMVIGCVAAIWATHGLEVVTALVIGVPFALAAVRGRPLRELAIGAAGVVAAATVAAIAVTILSRMPAVPVARVPAGITSGNEAVQMLGHLGTRSQLAHALPDFVRSELVTPAIALYVLGVAASLLVRGLRWALVVHLALLAILADVGYSGFLTRLWNPLFPWSGADRIVSLQWFVVPLLMAWGGYHAGTVMRPGLQQLVRMRHGAAMIRGTVAGVAALTIAVGTQQTLTGTQAALDTDRRSTDADVAALTAMDRMIPPGSLVLTQGPADAGQWTDSVTRDVEWAPLAFTRSYFRQGTIAPAADPRAAALHTACYDPDAARHALDGIAAVFVGSLPDPKAGTPWDPHCIAQLPGVRQADRVSDGGHTAWVFLVDPEP